MTDMMKKAPLFNRLPWASLLILLVLLSLIGCQSDANQEAQPLTALEITNFDRGQLEIGSTIKLVTDAPKDYQDELEWSSSSDAVTVDQTGKVTAVSVGKVARRLNGGGHEMAAGCTIFAKSAENAEDILLNHVAMELKK